MSRDPLSVLLCIPRDVPRTTIIRNLVTSLADANGTIGLWNYRAIVTISGKYPTATAIDMLSAATNEELKLFSIEGEFFNHECSVKFYGFDEQIMVERPTMLSLSFEEVVIRFALVETQGDPAYSDFFANRAIAFCEQLQVFFASWLLFPIEGLHERLAYFGNEPLQEYIGSYTDSPLLYCDATTYALGMRNVYGSRKVISLISGAKAIFGYSYMPWFNNDEIEKNIDWLRRCLMQHIAVRGAVELISTLTLWEQYLPVASDEDKQQIFRQLDSMRLLIATALQRPGLVSIMLPAENAATDAIAPIIADGGWEWCVYTEQETYDFASPEWSGPGGLWTQVLALREAAQILPYDDVPPRIIVVAWRTLADPVCEALSAAGITVIPSTQTFSLLEVG